MGALTAAVNAVAGQSDELTFARIRALMTGYDQHWGTNGMTVESLEEGFTVPLMNPNTLHSSRTWEVAGKRDGIVRIGNRRLLLEHKTCSESISEPEDTYWSQLAIDSQVSTYVLAAWLEGEKLDGTLYDVTRKLITKPKDITKGSDKGDPKPGTCAEIVRAGTYFGFECLPSERQQIASGQRKESYSLYEKRITADILARPAYYFQRREVPRLDQELLDHSQELWDIGKDMKEARRLNRHYKSDDACMAFGRPCGFLGICSGHDTTDSDNWVLRDGVHDELDHLENNGRDTLTNSRMKCFKRCRRQHFYRYELGIERVQEEESYPLYFGRLWHMALEVWFSFMREDKNGNCDSGDARSDETEHERSEAPIEDGAARC